ncbi:MAG: restriction endonuclease subunit S [Synergistaceae bacterium]|nr:restriction endonuclease subunit S [Synergistaceae bacterium]
MTLEGVRWREFVIGDLFTVEIGKSIDGDKVDKAAGKTPYITRKESNNGLDGFIDYDEGYINAKYPVITIGNETAEPFVQTFSFYTGTKVNILTPKLPQSWQTLLFIAQCLKIHKGKYSYAFTINSTRLRKQVIQLPVDKSGRPDYAFMERFMRQHEHRLIKSYVEQVSVRLRNTPPQKLLSLEGVTWGKFAIGDLFTLIPGKAKGANHLENDPSGISYLGATNRNNAVLDFVKPEDGLVQKGNCIAFIRNGEGSIGYSVYKAEDFIATSDITAGYSPFLDKYIGMFITTVADKVRGKYSFNYKRSDTRLKKEVIQLPITPEGLPDWHLMHSYMLSLEMQHLSAVITHFSQKLSRA